MGELFGKVKWLLGLGGLALFAGGLDYETPKMTLAGLCLLGLLGILKGAESLLSFRIETGDEETGRKTYVGVSAIPAAVLLLLFSTIELVLFSALLTDRHRELFTYLRAHVGVLWLLFGVMLVCFGFNGVLGYSEQNKSAGAFLRSLPGRLISALVVAAGITACVIGATAQREPATYRQWAAAARDRLPPTARQVWDIGAEVGGVIIQQGLRLADMQESAETAGASGGE
jgi:hypothetical protein